MTISPRSYFTFWDAAIAAIMFWLLTTASSFTQVDTNMYRYGYDIPKGIPHGTWDFDEWPGVDHAVVYKKHFLYPTSDGMNVKISYDDSQFDQNDHEGYLRAPVDLQRHGFQDMRALIEKTDTKTMLGIFAHPDDEILLAGGLLAEAALSGWRVVVVLASNGADGSDGVSDDIPAGMNGYNSFGIMPDGRVRVCTDSAGLMKAKELKTYASILGITLTVLDVQLELNGRTVSQLGEVPGLDWRASFGPGSAARRALSEALVGVVRDVTPSVIITHGTEGEYGNYLHRTVHNVTMDIVKNGTARVSLFTAFPEYNWSDKITHFLDLDSQNKRTRNAKYEAFRAAAFFHTPGLDYDKPWDPSDTYLDGAFVKDYGYTPIEGYPPRYEFYQLVETGK